MTVGERLKKLRIQKGLSQQELSNQIGINRSTYARYETNDNQADYETLQTLADFFSTSIDYLLGRTEEPMVDRGENYPVHTSDLHRIIRDSHALQFNGEQLDLNEEERQDLLRHMRLAWLMIKDKRQEKTTSRKRKKEDKLHE